MESTWAKTRTTHGHGINSQYKPEHWKEWVNGEKRNQERSSSPERSLNDDSSFHRSSLFYPIESDTVSSDVLRYKMVKTHIQSHA